MEGETLVSAEELESYIINKLFMCFLRTWTCAQIEFFMCSFAGQTSFLKMAQILLLNINHRDGLRFNSKGVNQPH